MKFDASYLEGAHDHCFGNEPEVRSSKDACCIACATSFVAKLATETSGNRGFDHLTVFCPICTFDTVIGDLSGYPVNDAVFVAAMNDRHFKEPLGSDVAWKELLHASN